MRSKSYFYQTRISVYIYRYVSFFFLLLLFLFWKHIHIHNSEVALLNMIICSAVRDRLAISVGVIATDRQDRTIDNNTDQDWLLSDNLGPASPGVLCLMSRCIFWGTYGLKARATWN